MKTCPFCGGPLRGILAVGKRGVRCDDEECLFNFRDLACPECGRPPERVEHLHPDTFRVFCASSHEWEHRFPSRHQPLPHLRAASDVPVLRAD
jgi:hypothetical protein